VKKQEAGVEAKNLAPHDKFHFNVILGKTYKKEHELLLTQRITFYRLFLKTTS